jgi:hypothetical protein
MTLLLIVASWAALVCLVVGLCAAARLGDGARGRQETARQASGEPELLSPRARPRRSRTQAGRRGVPTR